jgi:hypothetical protein
VGWNLLILAALVTVLLSGDALVRSDDAPNKPQGPVNVEKQLRRGMTQADVKALLGEPHRVARQILYRRYLEQWVYDGPNAARIEFDCVRGNEPQILTVHSLTPRRP